MVVIATVAAPAVKEVDKHFIDFTRKIDDTSLRFLKGDFHTHFEALRTAGHGRKYVVGVHGAQHKVRSVPFLVAEP